MDVDTHVMMRHKEWDHDRYPRCEGTNEDSDHILRCPARSARRQWLESLESFASKLEEYRTHPDIWRVLMVKL
jgi:pyrroloquinoline quinone (PQQ) biosynthesis protein C